MTPKLPTDTLQRTIQSALLFLAAWIFGAMAFMPAFLDHSARLVMLVALTLFVILIVRKMRQTSQNDYLVAAAIGALGAPAYYLLAPITGHGEWIFTLLVIAVSAQRGTRPGLAAALGSAVAFGLIASQQAVEVADVLMLTGLLVVSAVIIGTLVGRHEAALIARARVADELEKTSVATLVTLSRALDARDQDTEGHSERVADLAVNIGQVMRMSEPEIESLRLAALLHDIGKIGIPDAILHKHGSLNREERAAMNKHPQTGRDILLGIPFISPALDAILHHHEKYDGTGYPDGLSGNSISLSARILAVADVYDALTSHRPYRTAFSQKEALKMILLQSGNHFDPQVVRAFDKVVNWQTDVAVKPIESCEDRKMFQYDQ